MCHTVRVWSNPIGRVRLVGKLEALSFLALLCIAMPLKYAADFPMAVRIVGMVHGVLFVGLCYVTAMTKFELDWPIKRAALVMAASFVPFGPFLMDPRLEREQRGLETPEP